MTPERREAVDAVCLEALGKEGLDRAAFLDDVCRGDPDLRREVDSLLAGQSEAERFLEAPAWAETAAPLVPGTRLGPYEILSPLGAGGMGQVYRARDSRLDRTVAIKILPPALAADPGRRARFRQEARAIAALAHPHICTLFDVGELRSRDSEPSTLFLVMEHLAGETLAARLERSPLPLPQALAVATQIADALSAAHRQDVVHRDLKPGNVMLTKAGAKLLDFGLAKLKEHAETSATGAVPRPADPSKTTDGTVVGTLRYMAPEQIQGGAADARTDIWALGVLLHEMVTGKRAFDGDSAASLTAAILEGEPPALSALVPGVSTGLERLVAQCMAKAPDDRPDTAHDVASELRRIAQADSSGSRDAAGPRPRGLTRAARRVAIWALFFVAGGLVAAGLLPSRAPVPPVVRSALEVAPADALDAGGVSSASLPTPGGSRTALAWMPDGRSLVFVGRRAGVQQLYVRRLDEREARPLANTENAQAPAVSPDGLYVAFWANGAIRKVPAAGGPVTEVVPAVPLPPAGLAWAADGRLFFDREGRIWTVPVIGTPFRVTTVTREELAQVLPCPLPGGRVLLYTARKGWSWWSGDDVVALSLETGERKRLLTGAADARYVPSGHLVFLRRGVLHAVPFDPDRLELRGPQAPVLDHVAQSLTGANADDVTRAGQFAVSPAGTLAWIAGPADEPEQARLVAVDMEGRATLLEAPARGYGLSVRASPDGRRLAVTARAAKGTGLWVYDAALHAPLPLTIEEEVGWPVWTPDGRHLVFSWVRDGERSLAMQAADASGPPLGLGLFAVPSSFRRDGRLAAVVYRTGPGWGNGPDIALVTIQDGRAREAPLVSTQYAERWPEFSPNGEWLLYGSNVSGRDEIYVQRHPGPGGPFPVTVGGGSSPAWHPNGREIFFLEPAARGETGRMMTAPFTPGSPPRIGRARQLFEFDPDELAMACDFSARCYEVAPEGGRFYALRRAAIPSHPAVTHINLVQNWFEELKAKHPPAR